MEPIGALASVITIVGLIRPTAKFVKAPRGIASENGMVASEIHRMATRIQTSATSIDIALEDLKSHSSTLRRISIMPSKILQHMIDNKSIQTIVSGTQSISNQMRDKAQELKQLKKQPNLYKKLKWCIWDKMEVESLFPEMQLVAFMMEKSPGEVAQCLRQEIAYLRGQLKMVEKQCQVLMQEQHSGINSEFEAEFYATAKPLLRLARSVRRTGTVPATRRESPSRRASTSEETPLSIHREVRPVLYGGSTREMPRRTRRNTSRQSAIRRDFNSASPFQTPRPSSAATPSKPQSLSVPREAPSEISRHSSSSGESSGQHSALPSPSVQTPDTPLTPQSPDAPKPLRIDIRARESESPRGAIQAIQGYIINQRDHGKASPKINATTDHSVFLNYISVKTAQQLGLEIQELGPNPTPDDRHEMVMPGPVIATMATQSAQSKALVNLLKTGDYSDLTITCGEDQYHVHKALICPRSKFFKAACDGKFKVCEIDLPDDDPAAVRMMIEYLYHDTYVPAVTIIHRNRDSTIDAHLSDTEYNEQEKREMELYGAAFVGNKRIKRLTDTWKAPIAPISQPVAVAFGQAAPPPPPPPAASQEPGGGRGSFGGANSPAGWASAQASLYQSPSTSGPSSFASPAPAPTQPPAPQPSATQRSIPAENLHLHAKVYALGEKYGIQPLKALALFKFNCEAHFHLETNDFVQAVREAYTSTIETDRPLRDAVVAILRSNKHLLKKDSMKAVLKETALGIDLLMEFASE
ncbi:hypothetical protein FMUND_10115 [Fusarium mundagurra]|uniref:BTB domain-containing protein n=1 Tax=Fusarium mundagurra TaxID=1567541 RepID=A0A8H6DBP8_9HYPO|nr:hypothetical protein FMUND_10115 [Fusarium mundagurra]